MIYINKVSKNGLAEDYVARTIGSCIYNPSVRLPQLGDTNPIETDKAVELIRVANSRFFSLPSSLRRPATNFISTTPDR